MNQNLIEYYANLLILQYRKKERAPATIRALIKTIMLFDLIKQIENGYNIDDAVGVQLDILAKYVGAERVATGVDFSREFFGFVDYNEPAPYVSVTGLIKYDSITIPDAQILEYDTDQQSAFSLNDPELRVLIKLKIAQNNSNHSTGEIDDILNMFFPGQVIFTDNKDMTVSYIFESGLGRLIEVAVSERALPKPAAVGLVINFVPDINNIFSLKKYDVDTPANFSEGLLLYSDAPFGSFLKY